MRFASDLLFSRVIQEFPTLTFALSEGGIGWIPFILERLEDTYARQRAWTGDDLGNGLSPTDVFRRNFLACFIRDRIGVSLRDEIGIETMCWEMDYPHSDSSWPDAAEQLAAQLEGCNQTEVDAICWQNAATRFHYDGVERLGRESCTVGALRERVRGQGSVRTEGCGRPRTEARCQTRHLRRHEAPHGRRDDRRKVMTTTWKPASLDERVDRLESTDTIRQLPHRYALALDSRDISMLVTLFVPDVRVGPTKTGRQALSEWFVDAMSKVRATVHVVANHIIDFDDPDRAHGIVYCRDEVEYPDTGEWKVGMLQYHDSYRRTDGVWGFERRKFHRRYQVDALQTAPCWRRSGTRPRSDHHDSPSRSLPDLGAVLGTGGDAPDQSVVRLLASDADSA